MEGRNNGIRNKKEDRGEKKKESAEKVLFFSPSLFFSLECPTGGRRRREGRSGVSFAGRRRLKRGKEKRGTRLHNLRAHAFVRRLS